MMFSAVVPVYNEVDAVKRLHERLWRSLQGLGQEFEVIYVDDGSDDGTAEALAGLRKQSSAVKVVSFRRNCGSPRRCMRDSDRHGENGSSPSTQTGQNPPEEIAKLAAFCGTFDFVTGIRQARCDSFSARPPLALPGFPTDGPGRPDGRCGVFAARI